jgi:hypothetical protein
MVQLWSHLLVRDVLGLDDLDRRIAEHKAEAQEGAEVMGA